MPIDSPIFPAPGPRDRGWEESFAGATRPLLAHLVAVSRKILGDDDTAWDAVQEALMALWSTGEIPTNLRAWMVRAVVHRSLHLARCRSRRRRHEDRAQLGRSEKSDRDDPARWIVREELRRTIREALARIAPDHRSILVLNVVDRMDYESIAVTLGVPIGTVRSRLNRSRIALREAVSRLLPEEERIGPSVGRKRGGRA